MILFSSSNSAFCSLHYRTSPRSWFHRSHVITEVHIGILPKWSWEVRKELWVVVVFIKECHIRWMLLPKPFWGGTCHTEVMTERAGVLLFLHMSLLSHETVLQGMKICSSCKSVWGWNIICNAQLYYFIFIPLFIDFRLIFLVFNAEF